LAEKIISLGGETHRKTDGGYRNITHKRLNKVMQIRRIGDLTIF
jgi:hypothetical protein